jgi:hypothetical protein
MKTITITFPEIEHAEDLNELKNTILSAGAKILAISADYENEEATIAFEVRDIDAFYSVVKLKDTCWF